MRKIKRWGESVLAQRQHAVMREQRQDAEMEQLSLYGDGPVGPESLGENEIIDFITAKPVKLKGNEEVRQQIAHTLYEEYGIAVHDMHRGFPIQVKADGQRHTIKRADIAIFEPETEHTMANLRRVVICKPAPKEGRAGSKVRTHLQATDDINDLKDLLGTEEWPDVRYGLWTNGLDFFFLYKDSKRFGATFEPRANWPLADESAEPGASAPVIKLRRGEEAMLKTVFRRCHNYIHGNEGMPKDAAFWQFLYLLFAKVHDERVNLRTRRPREFYAGPSEPFDPEGQKAIRKRIDGLFSEVKKTYPLFEARDELRISDRAVAFIVGEIAPYDLTGTDADYKGIAYQELVGANLRGDRGQYFTPRDAVKLMVDILDPKEDETVLDPACGTGGFLRETLRHLHNEWREDEGTPGLPDTAEQLIVHQDRLRAYSKKHLFGADFDPFLARAANMGVMLLTGDEGNVYHMDSLAFPGGHLPDVAKAVENVPFGKVDVLMTNPPFGTMIKIEDPVILEMYRNGVARPWTRDKDTGRVVAADVKISSMSPEQLFIQRAVDWVRSEGKIGIVLPNGILSNPGPADEGIRKWILENCWVLASIELPVEAFIHAAGVNILTTLLFLKKKPLWKMSDAALSGQQPDYPVFMAVAEKVGVDRRGNDVYKRNPDGTVVWEYQVVGKTASSSGRIQEIHRYVKAIDNDLPKIAEAYKKFREIHPEPSGDKP